jgi:hypothetical protein
MKKRMNLFDNLVWNGIFLLLMLGVIDLFLPGEFLGYPDFFWYYLSILGFMGATLHFLRKFNDVTQWTIFDLFKKRK